MKNALKLTAAVGAALAMGSAHAVTVSGVTWNPDSFFDFSSTDTMIEKIVGNVGDVLNGYALIQNINGTGQNVFCASGCEVTYVFSGYTVTSASATGLVFSGGTISIYADSTPNWDQSLQSTATDGTLFLQLSGALYYDVAAGTTGTLFSDPTPASAGVAGDGRGFLNVVGGTAAAYFDTNTFLLDTDGDLTPDATADLQFTSSFQRFPNNGTFVSDNDVEYGLFGSNDIQGNTAVPEPTTLALVGLALLGAGAFRRRKETL